MGDPIRSGTIVEKSPGPDDAYFDRGLKTLLHHALHQWNIAVDCPACKRTRVFNGHQLWWLFYRKKWDDSMSGLCARLYCLRCWAIHHRRVRPTSWRRTTMSHDEEWALPWPDKREWKRMVSRYRS